MSVLTYLRPRPFTLFGAMLCLWLGAVPCWSAPDSPVISKEYQVKAVFLFNFTQFVQWPADTFSAPDEPFRIGILGDDPFGDFIDATVKGEKVNGHPLVVERYSDAARAKDCQILFVSRSETTDLERILKTLKDHPILTVGETEGFIQGGGILRFMDKDKQVHLRINPDAAKQVKLDISSKLLRLSELVQTKKEKP